MRNVITLCLFVTVFNAWAQTDFCATGKFSIKRFYRNDTLTITCDTAYLFNKSTYNLYKRLYQSSGTQDQKVKALLSSYDYMRTLYENRIAEQDEEYTQLRSRFDSLATTSESFIKTASSGLTEVKNSITIANNNIIAAQSNLKQTEANLKQEIIASRGKMFKWALGGFTIGVATTAIVILALN